MCCILGLLLCAKTKLAKAQLAAYFAEGATNAGKSRDETDICKARKISKFYRALVTGILENDEVMITQPIGLVRYPGVAEGLYAACSSGYCTTTLLV
jgi:23S rRNA-/tRNA-specific pseudouridylate synthase